MSYACKVCCGAFSSEEELGSHLTTHSEELSYVCKFCCDGVFSSEKELNSHLTECAEKKTYYCKVCPKTFHSKLQLEQHSSTHAEDRPYVCNACHMSFGYERSLKSHPCISNPKHTCTFCSMSFKFQADLDEHLNLHTGDRPHLCKTDCHAQEALVRYTGPYLKEIRIHLCQKSSESSGIREFIRKHYVSIKKQNPAFPILIRECEGVEPKIYARYDFGKESSASLSNHKSEQVLEVLKGFASK
ncbi:hypothetical protein JTE90_019686 [Oedothorax gibbosus]|uniref:C2H2-type domain-containing protein n=1 Tax=Oedothorax gibbosus TaxID=931172 RepID=A0AAV6UEZ9_9ARAC|nr:hypothetical protein JTE90_019686 [Oedothorax gibbosus]